MRAWPGVTAPASVGRIHAVPVCLLLSGLGVSLHEDGSAPRVSFHAARSPRNSPGLEMVAGFLPAVTPMVLRCCSRAASKSHGSRWGQDVFPLLLDWSGFGLKRRPGIGAEPSRRTAPYKVCRLRARIKIQAPESISLDGGMIPHRDGSASPRSRSRSADVMIRKVSQGNFPRVFQFVTALYPARYP